MKIIENPLGWEDEFGMQLAFKEKYSFMNVGRAKEHQRPIWRSVEDCSPTKKGEELNDN